jgi:hypothetical protein
MLICLTRVLVCCWGGEESERKHRKSARQVHARDRTLTTTLYLPFSHLFPLIPLAPLFSSNKLNHLSTQSNQRLKHIQHLQQNQWVPSSSLTCPLPGTSTKPSYAPPPHIPHTSLTRTALRRIPPCRPTLRLGRPPRLHDHGRTPLQCVPNLTPSPISR